MASQLSGLPELSKNRELQSGALALCPAVKLAMCLFQMDVFEAATLAIESLMSGASPVAQWLRIHLPMQGTWVRALVWEDPTCHGATKPMHHNY